MQFLSTLATYFLLMILFIAVGGIGLFLGITLRKKNDAKAAAEGESQTAGEVQ